MDDLEGELAALKAQREELQAALDTLASCQPGADAKVRFEYISCLILRMLVKYYTFQIVILILSLHMVKVIPIHPYLLC